MQLGQPSQCIKIYSTSELFREFLPGLLRIIIPARTTDDAGVKFMTPADTFVTFVI